MKAPSFWREVLLALAISVVGAVVHSVLVRFIGPALSLRVVVLLVAIVAVFLGQYAIGMGQYPVTVHFYDVQGLPHKSEPLCLTRRRERQGT